MKLSIMPNSWRLPDVAFYVICLWALCGVSSTASAQPAQNSPQQAVARVIMSLEKSWNAGDMTGYLSLYRNDETLALTFGNTVVEGWAALNTLFRDSYPDPLRMGRFSIDRLQVEVLNPDTAVAYGNFTHVFPSETIKGGYTHVLTRNASGVWEIRHERTSRGEVIETH